jgi:DNA-binding NarL/FixJ family response regulator
MRAENLAAKNRIFLVDDHPLVRESLTSLINQQPDMLVVGETEGAQGALEAIMASRAEIVIVDISLADGSGLELTKSIKALGTGVNAIVLSMHDERVYAERAIRAGARGYVMKSESTKRIVAAIRDVLLGRLAVSTSIADLFAERFAGGGRDSLQSPVESLSDRELEVFQLLGRGLETRQIATSLSISIKTVQAYCARIKQKLRLGTAAELLREAILRSDGQ